jgi:PAS domain S-box-containing protein/diguanylate cyclase (GGDEF)-like protein
MPYIRDPEIFRTILDSIQSGVYVVDRERRILFWNAGAERITGYQRHEVVGHFCRENILPNCDDHGCGLCGNVCPLGVTLHEGKSKEANVYFHHKDSHRLPVHLWAVPIRDPSGGLFGVAESFEVRRAATAEDRRLSPLASHGCLDSSTATASQSFTQFHLRENLSTFAEYQVPFGVLSIRLDGLARLRSSYGREAIDTALRAIADSIRISIRPTDFLGRWADDLFLVIAVGCTPAGLQKVAERMQKVAGETEIHWWGDELLIKTTIRPTAVQGGDTMESLLARVGVATGEPPFAKAAAASGEDNPSSSPKV